VIEELAQLGERVQVGDGVRVRASVIVLADTVIPDEPEEVVGASLLLR